MTGQDVVKPPALRPGDTIGLVTPGRAALFPRRLQRGISELERVGFRVRVGDCALKDEQSDAERIADIHSMIADPSVRAVMLTLAGEAATMLRVLDGLDFDLIRANPKVIIGQSAATTLLMGIYGRTGLVTFHGPSAIQHYGNIDGADPVTVESMLAVLGGKSVVYQAVERYADEFRDWDYEEEPRTYLPGQPLAVVNPGPPVRGRLIGGSLRGVVRSLQSGHAPDCTGAILFWDLPFAHHQPPDPGEVTQLFASLESTGVLDRIAGMVVSKPFLYEGRRPEAPVFTELLHSLIGSRYRFPVLSGFDSGHTIPMLTLPVGGLAELDTSTGRLRLLESAVSADT